MTIEVQGPVVPGYSNGLKVTGIINPNATAHWSNSAAGCDGDNKMSDVFPLPEDGQLTTATLPMAVRDGVPLYLCVRNGDDVSIPFDPQALTKIGMCQVVVNRG